MPEIALITGATGQIAAYLARQLLQEGVEVWLTDRHVSHNNNRYWRLDALGIRGEAKLLSCSLDHYDSTYHALAKLQPDKVFHLAANSSIVDTTLDEYACMSVNFGITHRLLQSYRAINPKGKFFFMGSSEQFGRPQECPQNELTPFHPRNPYGIAKTAAFELVRYYREHFGMFACSAISYNQESPLRGDSFVSRKITRGAVNASKTGVKFKLGDLSARRDWGHCRDYAVAISRILSVREPQDFILATGTTHSVSDFVSQAFSYVNKRYDLALDWEDFVEVDPALVRTPEAVVLRGDITKAGNLLEWEPTTSFKALVEEMVEFDCAQ